MRLAHADEAGAGKPRPQTLQLAYDEMMTMFDLMEELSDRGALIYATFTDIYHATVCLHTRTRGDGFGAIDGLSPEQRRHEVDRAFADLGRRFDGPEGSVVAQAFGSDLLLAVRKCSRFVMLQIQVEHRANRRFRSRTC